ncbi:SIMPL domain-containing protein [Sinomonas mesophila]|uniref:SIMPL domain-containing protein n=1 Tax=Sinomonas mesophila TaxID=1531955 RepID=UPI00158DA977|nr:SIMPL domain-containing protein [Sinomonas mesophila]
MSESNDAVSPAAATATVTAPSVTAVGTGTSQTPPDVAVVHVGTEARAALLGEAYTRASATARALVEAALGAGVAREDLATSGLGVRSETVWKEGQGPRVVGYAATTAMTVTARDLDAVGALLDALVAAGGNALTVHSLSLEASDPAAALASAHDAAWRDALATAERLAGLAGRRLGAVVRIDTAPQQPPGGPIPLRRVTLAASAEAMPVEAGLAEVSATVSVTWELVE